MLFTEKLKSNYFGRSFDYFPSIFANRLSIYKSKKITYKVNKIKHKLKDNGISYNKRTLFNDVNNEVLFIHIPKAAGMSVVKSLYNQNKSHHASASDYLNEDADKFQQAFSFAITRNPYTRLYSAYNYLKNGGMNKIDRAWWELYLAKYDSFESFIIEGGLEYAIEKRAEHFIPQYKFIFDNNEKLQCSFLGKVEAINEAEEMLSEKLQRRVTFTHLNMMSQSEPVLEDVYSKNMLAIVNLCYKKDLDLLGYRKIV
ncbi:sulfotransferase family 2 domain-containing protein [Psychromonas sp. GE-S-Ul-11]|uniref:sulfotransferase family 2 domain-containing protein n=1 Tax=Psychromonas sp. GE-S-Ul-11 TaxID=3241170 RepID=UPI00390C6224